MNTEGPADEQPVGPFLVGLAAALNAAEFPVDEVQRRVEAVGQANGAGSVSTSAFPTFVMVSLAGGEPVTLQVTAAAGRSPRLDRIDAIERLADDAARGAIDPAGGLARLDEIVAMPHRFGRAASVFGYAVLTTGICLVLRPARDEVLAAAVLGMVVGLMDLASRRPSPLRVLMPVAAAFCVALACGLVARAGWLDPGIRAIVASLVVFLPGATLTTAVVELGSGQTVSGASRLVSGALALGMLAFGILAGLQVAGLKPHELAGLPDQLGAWAPWLGVVIFAAGVMVTHSAPGRSGAGLAVVLVAAWCGQLAGNAVGGAYVGAFLGAVVLVLASTLVARWPGAMAAHAAFLPGFWLLVPGAMGLIGLTRWAGSAGVLRVDDLVATVGSIFAVAVGVLFGAQLWAWMLLTGKAVEGASATVSNRTSRFRTRSARHKDRRS
ncbi:threonine/serine exporter ThrE family protein [Aquihabitans daechungensis]|uniref:threonine/serine ThrE exporter family protein n=1 Tax=Aquihabitans daechungensis TaxID=1052257 RepID=UPI003B9FD52C